MNWTPKEFTHALVEMQWIQYHYRYDKEIADACDLIYKRIAEDRKNGVLMTKDIELPVFKMEYAANYCIENPDHPMFIAKDAARCVECNGLVNVKLITAAEFNQLPTHKELRERKEKEFLFKLEHHAYSALNASGGIR